MVMREAWVQVVGFKGYEVSNLGRVRSWRKSGRGVGLVESPKLRAASVHRNGYFFVNLSTSPGKYKSPYIHRLVLEAWVGEAQGRECRHLDGSRDGNRVTNLSWGSRSENCVDTSKMGNNCARKLTDAAVRRIREARAQGVSLKVLSAQEGVSMSTVSKVARGDHFRHVT